MSAIDYLRVLADWNRNGLWDHALSDITDRVLYAEWAFGYNAPGQYINPPATGTLVLDNFDGAFNLGKAAATYTGLLKRDVLVCFDHTDLGPLLTLRVVDIQIVAGQFGQRTVVLTLADWHAELMSVLYDPPLTLNRDTGNAINDAWGTGILPLPYAGSYWVVDASALDTNTKLYGQTGMIAIAGDTVLPYVGDNIDRGQGVSLYSFIEEMCAAEMDGKFMFMASTGPSDYRLPLYVYFSRTYLAYLYNEALVVEIAPSLIRAEGNEYDYGRLLCNSIEVTFNPRRVGSAGTELARNGSAMLIPGIGIPGNKSTNSSNNAIGNSRTFTMRYRDPDFPDGTCAATTIIAPVASTDYTGNLEPDGSGEDYTGNLIVTVENLTNAARVTVSNTALGDVYLTLLKIRGTPLTARQSVTLNAADGPSIAANGLNRQTRQIAGIDDQELVQLYADYTVNRYKDPTANYRTIVLDAPEPGDPHYTLFGPLTAAFNVKSARLLDTYMNDNPAAALMWVCGERHTVDASARSWEWGVYMEPYSQHAFWQLESLDMGTLGSTTKLGF